ncbi:hypothetical protein TNCV_4400671 [Trichonephila clavipes]|nr:hypothetical protein TNCV_4400671 [Trichonephila clavipes]
MPSDRQRLMPPDRHVPNRGPRNSSWQRARLSVVVALSIIQMTIRFGSFLPQFWNPEGGEGSPTSLPPISHDDLRLDRVSPCREGTIHLQTSMPSPGIVNPDPTAQQSASLTTIPERQH